MTPTLLDADQTCALLPWPELVDEIAALLRQPEVHVPPRLVLPLAGGGSLFVMPASDAHTAMTKIISYTPANVGTATPTIQGEVAVFDVASGTRRLVLDGPAVTARRTAAVSALAARLLAPRLDGPLLVVGAGVQGQAHVQAFAQALGVRRLRVASRRRDSAQALVEQARRLGLQADVAEDANAALADCPLVVTCTPAAEVVLHGLVRDDAFIAAVGAFTPGMRELDAPLCRHIAAAGRIVLDTPDARHEAGDLIQAGVPLAGLPTLIDEVLGHSADRCQGPVLFKSCGWAGWDLAAARLARRLAG